MAYQNVGTPVFYVDNHLFLSANGVTPTNTGEMYNLSPGSHNISVPVDGWYYFVAGTGGDNNSGLDYSYVAAFGHNFADLGDTFKIYLEESDSPHSPISPIHTINGGGNSSPPYNGWTLFTVDKNKIPAGLWVGYPPGGDYVPSNPLDLKISSLSIGTHYTMPNAPNLSLTLSREYGGTKEFTTHNGSSMSNTMWSSPAKWGNLGAWELRGGYESDTYPENFPSELSRSGRRTWDLKFSLMDDGNLWGSNQLLSYVSENTSEQNTNIGYESDDVSGNSFNYNLLTDDNFFSQVWNKTLGGTIPFIFQPDSSNRNPDQFCIAKFKNNSLKATQSAFNVYDISLSIEEVW